MRGLTSSIRRTSRLGRLCSIPLALVLFATAARLGVRSSSGESRDLAIVEQSPLTRLESIPSHNRLYRASMRRMDASLSEPGTASWVVTLRTASNALVSGATLVMQSWMPDSAPVAGDQPRTTAYLGDGTYRVDGLRFDRPGWWNVKLQITAAGRTDSLAFNMAVR